MVYSEIKSILVKKKCIHEIWCVWSVMINILNTENRQNHKFNITYAFTYFDYQLNKYNKYTDIRLIQQIQKKKISPRLSLKHHKAIQITDISKPDIVLISSLIFRACLPLKLFKCLHWDLVTITNRTYEWYCKTNHLGPLACVTVQSTTLWVQVLQQIPGISPLFTTQVWLI